MTAQTPIKATTQKFLEIEAIEDDFVILKNGSCCIILETTAINFGLLSEREQEATIFAYANFLNSLAFSIQIVVHSRQKDISSYLELINQQLNTQKNEKLKQQTEKYRQFIKDTVKKNWILDKDFFIIIRYSALQLTKTPKKTILETKSIIRPSETSLAATTNISPSPLSKSISGAEMMGTSINDTIPMNPSFTDFGILLCPKSGATVIIPPTLSRIKRNFSNWIVEISKSAIRYFPYAIRNEQAACRRTGQ